MFNQLPKQDWNKAGLIDMFSIILAYDRDFTHLGVIDSVIQEVNIVHQILESGLDGFRGFPLSLELR